MCHIFLCIYQVLHNKIKRLKIKREKAQREAKVTLRWSSGPLCWRSLGAASGAPARLASPGFSDPTQQGTWPRFQLQPGEWPSISTGFNCSFFFFPQEEPWQASGHGITAISAPLSYSVLCLISTVASYSATVIAFGYPVGPEQNFLRIAPSYSKGLQHPPWKTCLCVVLMGSFSECDYQAPPSLLLTTFFLSGFHNSFSEALTMTFTKDSLPPQIQPSFSSWTQPNCDLLRKSIQTWK